MAAIKTEDGGGNNAALFDSSFNLESFSLRAIAEDSSADMLSWKSLRILIYFSGHSYSDRIVQRVWRLTDTKAYCEIYKGHV